MVGEVVAGRYEVEELVGTGGNSSVFRARDTLLERNVALKILHRQHLDDDEYVERFRREARAVAQLSHPNIVTVIDRGEEDGSQFIVFEFVDGENLKELIQREGPLPVEEALRIAIDIAHGLAFAHAQGIVHRDVKPQNVLLNGDGRPQVTDFGIARSLDVDKGVTQTGTVLGTSNYIAPEQASGDHVDQQSDIYSLGVVLFELLTARLPFEGDNFVAIAMQHINQPAPDVRNARGDIPPRVAAAVARALEKDPARRFPTMDAFAAELEAALHEPDTGATMIVTPQQRVARPRRVRRHSPVPWLLVVLALAALAVIVALALAFHPHVGGIGGGSKKGGGSTAVKLSATTAYDPQGGGDEHNEAASRATDGNASTYWYTHTYASQDFGGLKAGVGLVLHSPATLKSLTVTSDTPGFQAVVKQGATAVSSSETVGTRTTFTLHGAKSGDYVLWLTRLPPGDVAHVNEVTAKR
jgi:eukaryotic-like serine/threonine-protein kinase